MSSTIKLILDAIENQTVLNNNVVRTQLLRFPLGALPKEQADILLNAFLEKAMTCGNTSCVPIILDVFDIARTMCDPLPAVTNLLLNAQMSQDTLYFATSCYPGKIPIDYFIDIINMNDDDLAFYAAKRCTVSFPSFDEWHKLVAFCTVEDDNQYPEDPSIMGIDDSYQNPSLKAYFIEKMKEVSNVAEKPSWVREYEKLDMSMPPPFCSVDSAKSRILSVMNQEKMTQQLIEHITAQYAFSTIAEKCMMLNLPVFDDQSLFREYGPLSECYNHKNSDSHQCSKYGCRMFLCREFVDNDPDDDVTLIEEHVLSAQDWFTGVCDNKKCNKDIKKRHYSIRLPVLGGGWKGCYCSLDCAKQFIDTPLTCLLLGRVLEQLDVIGIRDR